MRPPPPGGEPPDGVDGSRRHGGTGRVAERKARGGSLLRRWAMAATRSPPRAAGTPGGRRRPRPPRAAGQQRDPADRGEPCRRPGQVGVGGRALVAPELLAVPLQLDPHGLAVGGSAARRRAGGPGRRSRASGPGWPGSTPRSPPGRPAPGATGAGRRGEVLESTAPSAPPGASAPLPEAASLAEAGLTASRIAGSICRCRHRAAISGCEGREGAGQTVKEPGRRCAYAGPLTSHFSCAFTISYRTQFPEGMPDTNLAPRKSRRAGQDRQHVWGQVAVAVKRLPVSPPPKGTGAGQGKPAP